MTRICLACGDRPADTLPDWPPLCEPCLDRAGEPIEPGDRVVCTVDEGCSGIVERLEDDELQAVVRIADGTEAWLPVADVVRAL